MPLRKIVKRRIGPDGIDIGCEEDAEIYFDLKEHKKTVYKQGRGEHFRRTVYTYIDNSSKRTYEDPPLSVKNPEQTSQEISYQRGVIKHCWIQCGRGEHFQRTKVHFDNTEENVQRQVRVQRVENSEDPSQYLDVERITRYKLKQRRGELYQAKRVIPTNTEEQIEAMEGVCKE
jgi:hypothetical protein